MKETLHLKYQEQKPTNKNDSISEEQSEEQPLLIDVEDDDGEYNTFPPRTEESENRNAISHDEQGSDKKSFFGDVLTPQVLAISVLYSVVAFQMLYFDGN